MVNRKKDQVQNRIVNGDDTEQNEYPWMVALSFKHLNHSFKEIEEADLYFCGGSIISSKTILTVAHCFDKLREFPNATMFVEVGQHKRNPLFSKHRKALYLVSTFVKF